MDVLKRKSSRASKFKNLAYCLLHLPFGTIVAWTTENLHRPWEFILYESGICHPAHEHNDTTSPDHVIAMCKLPCWLPSTLCSSCWPTCAPWHLPMAPCHPPCSSPGTSPLPTYDSHSAGVMMAMGTSLLWLPLQCDVVMWCHTLQLHCLVTAISMDVIIQGLSTLRVPVFL